MPIERNNPFPTHCLSKRYKTVLLKSLREELGEKVPSQFWKLAWVVYNKKMFPGTGDVVTYLGRYIKRVGIGASRILKVDKHGVEFRYRHRLNRNEHEFRPMHLSGEEFMRRYLQHILPKGFVRIRYHGLLHTSNAEKLAEIKRKNGDVIEEKEPWESKCEKCDTKRVKVREIRPWWAKGRKKGWKFYLLKGKGRTEPEEEKKEGVGAVGKGGAPPYNNLFNPTNAGRHAFRLRESRAGSAASLLLRRREAAPCPAG